MKKIALLAVVAAAGTASADSVNFDFNLENWGGIAETVIDFDFGLGAVQSIDSVVITLAHSWASDIDFSLTSSAGTVFDLTSDNGAGVDLGDGGSLLAGVGTYTFVMANGFGNWGQFGFNLPAPSGTYDAETWQAGPFTAGTWNILLVDDAGGDDGAVGSVTINYTAVPAPASVALLGLGGLVATRRRRA